jgi:hypothetical protein
MDMITELNEKIKALDVAIKQLKNRGTKLAESEKDYRVALAHKLLQLRTDGHPVTIIENIAKGNADIANLRMARDIDETMYKSVMEYINVVKLQIKVIENQIQREWGK